MDENISNERQKHEYLLRMYALVNDYFSEDNIDFNFLPEIVVAFCTVVEKILKIELYEKNPFLVFDQLKLKDDDICSVIAINKESCNIETIKIENVLTRYNIIFEDEFSEEEINTVLEIYRIRNFFVHGYKIDRELSYDKEDVVKKMGTVWGKIIKIANKIYGEENIRNVVPKKRYSNEELHAVLTREVKEKISNHERYNIVGVVANTQYSLEDSMLTPFAFDHSNKCPRCDSFGFSLKPNNKSAYDLLSTMTGSVFHVDNLNSSNNQLYRCPHCGLELTKLEFEIAKKINQNEL